LLVLGFIIERVAAISTRDYRNERLDPMPSRDSTTCGIEPG
jgi:hypothetical protein